jgi:hypothetical protein
MSLTNELTIIIRQREDQHHTTKEVAAEIRKVARSFKIRTVNSDNFDMSCFTLGEDVARNLGARFDIGIDHTEFTFDFTQY